MEKLRWYFKNGTCYEDYSVLYRDNVEGGYILVQNDDTGEISFGRSEDFGTLYGFPVSWSCLAKEEAVTVIMDLKKIDEKPEYSILPLHAQQIERWDKMIAVLTNCA